MVRPVDSAAARVSRRGLLTTAAVCLLGLAGSEAEATLAPPQPAGGPTSGPASWRDADPAAVVVLDPRGRRIALTFDDGPDPEWTPQVLDVLAAHRVPATFFVIGRNAAAHPGLVRRIVAEGHAVANHTQDHLWLDRLPARAVAGQLGSAAASLQGAGAPPTTLVRPPRGWTSPTVAGVLRARRERAVFWTVCLEAHLGHGTATATGAAAFEEHLRPGAIVLCHDGGHLDGPNPQRVDRSGTVAALPAVLDLVRARGLRPVTLPGALGPPRR